MPHAYMEACNDECLRDEPVASRTLHEARSEEVLSDDFIVTNNL